jgi:endonuclease G
MKKFKSHFPMIYLLILLLLSGNAYSFDKGQKHVPQTRSVHIELGIPTDADSTDDYLIFRSQYVLSYNKNKNVANWVSWNLNADWYGDVPRYKGKFIADTSLPAGFYRVTHNDYSHSGYDRGHIVRSEERTNSVVNNKSTFILTNILPQSPDLNQGVWLNFEYFCESLAKDSLKELYIIAGGIFHNGYKTIGNGVAVPDSCFKIVVALDKGKGLKDININTPVYAVCMPNIQGIRRDKWEKYRTTIRRIENSTGYDFLNYVPEYIENVLETKK